MPEAVCGVCRQNFQFVRAKALDTTRGGAAPPHCGRLRCAMKHDYTAEDWAGKARMVRARLAAGRVSERGPLLDVVEVSQTTSMPVYGHRFVDVPPLDPIDEEALRRAGGPRV